MHGILSGDSALEKNKAGTRGRSARVLIRTNRKGLPERVASEQGRTGKASQRQWHPNKDEQERPPRESGIRTRTYRKGLTERVASEQGSEGGTSSPAVRCPRERNCIEKASCQAHEGGRFLACSRVSRRARR